MIRLFALNLECLTSFPKCCGAVYGPWKPEAAGAGHDGRPDHCPSCGAFLPKHPVPAQEPAHTCATRTQQVSGVSRVSKWKRTLARPYMSIKISVSAGPVTTAVSMLPTTGLDRGGHGG